MTPALQRGALLLLVLLAFSNRRLVDVADLSLRADWIGAALALAVVAVLLVQGRRPPWSATLGWLGAFVLVQLVAAVWNRAAWPGGLKFGAIYVFALCYVLAVVLLVQDRQTARFALTVILGVAVVEAVLSVTTVLVSNVLDLRAEAVKADGRPVAWIKARGFMNEGNIFASLLLVPLALALWRWGRPLAWRWPPALLAGALSGTLVFTLTRTAWATAFLLVLTWIWRVRPAARQVAFVAASVGAAGLLLAASEAAKAGPAAPRSGLHRQIVRPVLTQHDPAVQGRLVELRTGFRSFRRQPWIGRGPGSSNAVRQRVAGQVRSQGWIANGTMFILHDSGAMGLAALGGIVLTAVLASRRAARRFRDPAARRDHEALALGLAGVFICWQSTNAFWAMYGYVYLALLLALHALSADDAAAPAAPGPDAGAPA